MNKVFSRGVGPVYGKKYSRCPSVGLGTSDKSPNAFSSEPKFYFKIGLFHRRRPHLFSILILISRFLNLPPGMDMPPRNLYSFTSTKNNKDHYKALEIFAPKEYRQSRWESDPIELPAGDGTPAGEVFRSPRNSDPYYHMLSGKYKAYEYFPNGLAGSSSDLGTRAINVYLSSVGASTKCGDIPRIHVGNDLNKDSYSAAVPLKRRAEYRHSAKKVKLNWRPMKTICAYETCKGGKVAPIPAVTRNSRSSFRYEFSPPECVARTPPGQSDWNRPSLGSSRSQRKSTISALLHERQTESPLIEAMEYRCIGVDSDPPLDMLSLGLIPQKYLCAGSGNEVKAATTPKKSQNPANPPMNNEYANLLFLWPFSGRTRPRRDYARQKEHTVKHLKTAPPHPASTESILFDLNASVEKKDFEHNTDGNIEISLENMLSKYLNYIPASVKNVDSVLQALVKSGFPGKKYPHRGPEEQIQYDWANYAQISLLQNALASDFKKRTSSTRDPPLWYGFTDAMHSIRNIMTLGRNKQDSKDIDYKSPNQSHGLFSAMLGWIGRSTSLLKGTNSQSSEEPGCFDGESSFENVSLLTLNELVMNNLSPGRAIGTGPELPKEPIEIAVLFSRGRSLFGDFLRDENNRYRTSVCFLLCDGSTCRFSIPQDISLQYNLNSAPAIRTQKPFKYPSGLHLLNAWDKTPSRASELFTKFMKSSMIENSSAGIKLFSSNKSNGTELKYRLGGNLDARSPSLRIGSDFKFKSTPKPSGSPIPIPIETLARTALKCRLDGKYNIETKWEALLSGLKEFSRDGEVVLDCLVGDVYFRNRNLHVMHIPRLKKRNFLDALDFGYQIRAFIVREQADIDSCLGARTNDDVKDIYRRFQSHVIMAPHMKPLINVRGVMYVSELIERYQAHINAQPPSQKAAAYRKFLASDSSVINALDMFNVRGADVTSTGSITPAMRDVMLDCLFADKSLSSLWKYPALIDYPKVYDAHKALCDPGVKAAMKDLEINNHTFTMPPRLQPYTRDTVPEDSLLIQKAHAESSAKAPINLISDYARHPFQSRALAAGIGSRGDYFKRLTQDCLQYYPSKLQHRISKPPQETPKQTPSKGLYCASFISSIISYEVLLEPERPPKEHTKETLDGDTSA